MYDFNDPCIELMVARDHNPWEVFTVTGAGLYTSHGIHCDKCHREWPCPPIVQLREFREEGKEGAAKERARAATGRDPGRPQVIKLARNE